MAETIQIAGKPFPKSLIYVGAAATAGIVVYAWFTKTGTEIPTEESELIPSGSGERIPPTTINSSGVSVDTRTGIKTNAEWRNAAVEKLQELGIDVIPVSSAIGKFLQHKPLTKTEADLVRQAIGAAGNPPEGGPWTVIEDQTPAAVGLPAPGVSGAPFGGHGVPGIRWQWSPIPGATGYDTVLEEITGQVVHNGVLNGADAAGNVQIPTEPTRNTWTSWGGLDDKMLYKLTVYARNSAGNRGDPGSGTSRALLTP